ncbi:MAG: ribbon-helix-helix domain-containing protein [archaeon]
MKMLSVEVDDKLASELDEVIRETGFYSSRSEFLKDAIRKGIASVLEDFAYRKKVRAAFRKLATEAKAKGWDGRMPTREERDQIARDFIAENGIIEK